MQVHSFIVPGAQASTGTNSSNKVNPVQDTNDMFMKLLTAQLKNQSPLNPVDPMQFTTQLVQFNMLSQLTQINSVLQQGLGKATAGSTQPVSGGK